MYLKPKLQQKVTEKTRLHQTRSCNKYRKDETTQNRKLEKSTTTEKTTLHKTRSCKKYRKDEATQNKKLQ